MIILTEFRNPVSNSVATSKKYAFSAVYVLVCSFYVVLRCMCFVLV